MKRLSSRELTMHPKLSQIQTLILLANTLDRSGRFHHADAISSVLASLVSSMRCSQQLGQAPTPQSSAVRNTSMPVASAPNACLNPNVPKIDLLGSRISRLRGEITNDSSQLPTELQNTLLEQIDSMIRALLPSQSPQSRADNRIAVSKFRVAATHNVVALKRSLNSLQQLANEILGTSNATLFSQIASSITCCENYLTQYENGVRAGFKANLQAEQFQSGKTATPGEEAANRSPLDDLTPGANTDSSEDWYVRNGTSREFFFLRCKAWAHGRHGMADLATHLRESNIPSSVKAQVLKWYGEQT